MAPKRRRNWLWILAILLVVGGGAAFFFFRQRGDKPIAITTEKAENRTLTSIVTATGKIHPEVEVKISSEVAGEIVDLPVKEGQTVQKGDLMVRIKPDTYESQVRQQEAAINAAKARSLQAKAEMLQSEVDLKRMQELFTNGFTSQSEIDRLQTQNQVQQAAYESSQFQIKQAETLLEEARENLAKTAIFAPMNGTISALHAELGERVVGTGQFEGTEIMRVADLNNMEVRIEVSETDIVNVKIADRAKITVDAFPDHEFSGQVFEIASSAINAAKASSESSSSSQEQITTFEVRIRIDELDPRLRPGMTATADIETATVTDVVTVPLQSVTVRDKKDLAASPKDKEKEKAKQDEKPEDEEGKPNEQKTKSSKKKDPTQRVVFIVKDGEARIRPVKTGLSDTSHIEIKEGVKAGEEIVSGSYSAITRELKDGAKITIKKKDDKAKGRP